MPQTNALSSSSTTVGSPPVTKPLACSFQMSIHITDWWFFFFNPWWHLTFILDMLRQCLEKSGILCSKAILYSSGPSSLSFNVDLSSFSAIWSQFEMIYLNNRNYLFCTSFRGPRLLFVSVLSLFTFVSALVVFSTEPPAPPLSDPTNNSLVALKKSGAHFCFATDGGDFPSKLSSAAQCVCNVYILPVLSCCIGSSSGHKTGFGKNRTTTTFRTNILICCKGGD